MSKNGIDVSTWQGAIDWPKVKAAGIDFAMIRLGFGSSDGATCKLDNTFTVKPACVTGGLHPRFLTAQLIWGYPMVTGLTPGWRAEKVYPAAW